MLQRVNRGRCHLAGERHRARRHPQDGDAAELQTLHGVHGGEAHPVRVRPRVVFDADHRHLGGGQLVVHLVQQHIEARAHADLGRPDALGDPAFDALDERCDLRLFGAVAGGLWPMAVQERAVAGQVVAPLATEVVDGNRAQDAGGPGEDLLRAAVVDAKAMSAAGHRDAE